MSMNSFNLAILGIKCPIFVNIFTSQKMTFNQLEIVKEYYGKVLSQTSDLKTTARVSCEKPPSHLLKAVQLVPQEVAAKYYGCGLVVPIDVTGKQLRCLDLGCGSGRDLYVLGNLVGSGSELVGVDMTIEQLEVARKHANALPQVRMNFLQGYIESLDGIADQSIDLVLSNCVLNLSPAKELVLKEVHRVLAPGGEFYFSDVYADRRLSEIAKKDPVLLGECLGGALYINDFLTMARAAGFLYVYRNTAPRVIEVENPELRKILGDTVFYSITYRLFKLNELEPFCEDYGQTAIYNGSVSGSPDEFIFDESHVFPKGEIVKVCGNTAAVLSRTRLAPHFQVNGKTTTHLGQFDCAPSTGSCTVQGSCC
jgi:arsenite methyltransferase